MIRLFSKFQMLIALLFFMTAPWSYSQATGMTSGERSAIDLSEISLNTMEAATSGVKNPDAFSLPFYEGFEGSANIPAGWTQEVVNGPLWKVGNGNPPFPPQAYSGNRNLVFRSHTPYASGLITRLVTPALDMSGTETAVLKFYYANAGIYNFFLYLDRLTIKYKSAIGDEWTTIETFHDDLRNWTEVSIVLPNLSDTYYIAFEGESKAGMGISIDEITITGQQIENFIITAEATGNGSITPSGEVPVPAGATQQFNLEADYGHHISSLLVDGQAITAAVGESQFSYTFASVIEAHSIMANFMPDAHSVAVEVVPSEAGSVEIQGELFYGNIITLLAASAGDEYAFSHWTSNGVTIGTENPFVFSLQSDTLIQAHFTENNSGALPLPFYEGFEASNQIPAGWTQEVVNGPLWKVGNGNPPFPSHAYAGSRNLVFRSYVPQANGLVTRLVTPPLDLTGANTPVLKFTYVNPLSFDFFFYQDVLTIKYKAALGDEWTTLETFNSDVKDWTDVFITLPNPSAGYYIAFEGRSNAGLGISIDEISINEGIKITSQNGNNGTIYPLGEVYVPIGSSPRYKVSANYHYRIASLLVDNEPIAEAVDQEVYYYTFPLVNTVHTIVATFIWSESYTVSAEAVPSEAGTVHISGNLFYNETITLDAWLNGTRYYFSHWSSNGDSISAANPFSFVLKSDTTFQANYKLIIEPLTLPYYEGFEAENAIPFGWSQELITGPLWTVGSGNTPYPPNAYSGNNNLVFRSDDPNASGQITRLVSRQLNMSGITSAVLKFQYVNAEKFNSAVHQDKLTIKYKASYNDPWTTITSFNSDVKEWTEASIILPSPSADYFIAFEGTSNAGYGISIDEITVNEQEQPGFFITAAAGNNGSIHPSGQVFVPTGETKLFNVEADNGYHISSLLVDGQAISAAVGESQFSYTFASVVAAHTIMAYFLPNALNVVVEVVPSEAGFVNIQGAFYYGNTITLYPTPTDDAYIFSHWTSNGVTISTANPFSFVLVSDTLIQAHFTENNGGTITLPFYEGFEAGNNIPYNWSQVAVNGNGPYLWYIDQGNAPYPPQAYAGNNNLVFRSNDPTSSGRISRMITPELDMTGAETAILKFYYVNAGYHYIFDHQDWLTIKYKAAWADPWTALETFNSDVREWTEASIVLPNLSDTYYIAFEGESNAGYGISVDEITITGDQTTGYIIAAGTHGRGSIDPSGQVFVPTGETQQFYMKAKRGNYISSLLVDDVVVAEARGKKRFTYTFESVGSEHTIVAYFKSNAISVKVNIMPLDAGFVEVKGDLYYGDTITLWPVPAAGEYVFSHWTSNGVNIGTETPLSFVLMSDTLIQANFGRVTGIDHPLNESLQIYPNPAHDFANIVLPAKASVQVFDLQGRMRFEANLPAGIRKLNLSGFEQGMYIIKVQFEDRLITKRILHF